MNIIMFELTIRTEKKTTKCLLTFSRDFKCSDPMKLQLKFCQRDAKCPLKYFANLSATSSLVDGGDHLGHYMMFYIIYILGLFSRLATLLFCGYFIGQCTTYHSESTFKCTDIKKIARVVTYFKCGHKMRYIYL